LRETWDNLVKHVGAGNTIRYWGKQDGYANETFTITNITEERITAIIPNGEQVFVSRSDYKKTSALFDDYVQSKILSKAIRDQTWRSVYVFSLVHALREKPEANLLRFGSLISPSSRVNSEV
jgi:hypothetical protein